LRALVSEIIARSRGEKKMPVGFSADCQNSQERWSAAADRSTARYSITNMRQSRAALLDRRFRAPQTAAAHTRDVRGRVASNRQTFDSGEPRTLAAQWLARWASA